jgi:hypothetical protein
VPRSLWRPKIDRTRIALKSKNEPCAAILNVGASRGFRGTALKRSHAGMEESPSGRKNPSAGILLGTPGRNGVVGARERIHSAEAGIEGPGASSHQVGARLRSTIPQIGSVIEALAYPGMTTGSSGNGGVLSVARCSSRTGGAPTWLMFRCS